MPGKEDRAYVCDKCGNEAEMTVKETGGSAEHRHEPEPIKGILVCKVCGNEAEMILEEI